MAAVLQSHGAKDNPEGVTDKKMALEKKAAIMSSATFT
jgi:hypothetical protein